MAEELAYVLINPYTIAKSRTGGVISRLLNRSNLELVATRMFSPSEELIEEYLADLDKCDYGDHADIKELVKIYVKDNYSPDPKTGKRARVMFFLFKGEDAVSKLRNDVVGYITKETIAGETIRDTYGDYVKNSDGTVKYFEPAVIMVPSSDVVKRQLDIWCKYSETDSGLLRDIIIYEKGAKPQITLVLIKPDCFRWPSGRPGNIVDMFSKTGLYIIGTKVVRMSVEKAEKFYGPVKEVLLEKLKGNVVGKVQKALDENFDFDVPSDIVEETGNKLNEFNAENQFNQIIKFMTGLNRVEISSGKEKKNPGKVKCLALVYQGIDAVSKIRAVLGATDPSKAAPSTIRKEFGQDVLVNTAHASDSPENAVREIGIVDIEENDLKKVVNEFYKE